VTLNDLVRRNGYYLSKHDGCAVLFAVAELLVVTTMINCKKTGI